MSEFVIMEEEDQILGKFSTRDAAEAARLEYCSMIAAHKDSELFKKFMESTLVANDPKKKEIGRIA